MDESMLSEAVAIGVKLSEAQLIRSSEGNLSLRRDDSSFFISPSGSKVHVLNSRDFTKISIEQERMRKQLFILIASMRRL